MRRLLAQIAWLIARLTAFLAACIGCAPRHLPAPSPRQTHWHSQETGYESITTAQPKNPKPGAPLSP